MNESIAIVVFFVACAGFVGGLVWLARRTHPLMEFRSLDRVYRSVETELVGWARIGPVTYTRALRVGVWDGSLVLREAGLFFGVFGDVFVVPLSRIRRTDDASRAVIRCDGGDVRVEMDPGTLRRWVHSGL